MKVLLVGNGPRRNRGCEAITITTVDIVSDVWPHAEIEVLSFDPASDAWYEEELGVKVSRLVDSGHRPGPLAMRAMRYGVFLKGYFPLAPFEEKLSSCDLVLSLGGDNYTDDYGGAYLFWQMARLAKRHRKPFVIWGASVGPFNSLKTLKAAKSSLKCVPMVTAREDETVNYLTSLGYGGEVVRVYDSAFSLEPRSAVMPDFGRNAEIVGFNISPIYHEYTSKTAKEVLDESRAIVIELSGYYNVLLTPHVMAGAGNDDALYMEQLTRCSPYVRMANPAYSSMELKYLISRCSLFIGARTHATIAAFSSCVPTVSLGYSIKARGINLDLFGHDRYLVEADDYNAGTVLAAAKLAAREREEITSRHRDNTRRIQDGLQKITTALARL